MKPPASGTSSSFFPGVTVDDCLEALDPRKWSKNAPELWNASYIADFPNTDFSRATAPAPTPAADSWPTWTDEVFYEDVHVLGHDYRNALNSSFARHYAPGGGLKSFEFSYGEIDCLNNESNFFNGDGGIDVDNGRALCRAAKDGKTDGVYIEFSKTVRFTEPRFAEAELASLAEVLVPLTLDSWLHLLVFNKP